ncbi:MAG: hypothetical protein AAFR35_12300 [Pseudomonadota bacterium]
MGSLTDAQRAAFDARVSRIKKGGPNTRGQIFVGVAEGAEGGTTARTVAAAPFMTMADILMVPLAFAIGMFSLVAGQVAMFHFFSADGAMPLIEGNAYFMLFGDICVATILAVTFGWALRLGATNLRRMAVLAGVAAVFLAKSTLVGAAPDFFSALYSPSYVATMLAV